MKYIISIILVIGLGVLFWFQKKPKVEPIHYHAGFVVFKNNQKVDFADFKYMQVQDCALHVETNLTPEEIQIEKAHLHDMVGDVVHVHQNGSVWGDLFKNVNYQLDANFQAYVNGERIDNFSDYPINAFDSVVILEGNNDDIPSLLNQSVTKSYIEEIDKKSESCGK